MSLTRKRQEVISHRGNPINTTVFVLRPTGWKSIFWKATLWVDPSSGIILHYDGPAQDKTTKDAAFDRLIMVFQDYVKQTQ